MRLLAPSQNKSIEYRSKRIDQLPILGRRHPIKISTRIFVLPKMKSRIVGCFRIQINQSNPPLSADAIPNVGYMIVDSIAEYIGLRRLEVKCTIPFAALDHSLFVFLAAMLGIAEFPKIEIDFLRGNFVESRDQRLRGLKWTSVPFLELRRNPLPRTIVGAVRMILEILNRKLSDFVRIFIKSVNDDYVVLHSVRITYSVD